MKRHAYAIVGLITILTAIGMSSTTLKAAPASSSNVTVTNGAGSPIPTMSVGGTVSVTTVPPITISGTPNVKVANAVQIADGSKVKVDDSTPIVVRQMKEAKTYVHNTQSIGFGQNEIITNITLYTIPAGKQLEIKDIYAMALGANGQYITHAYITIYGNGMDSINYPMEVKLQGGPDAQNLVHWNGSIHDACLIAPPGSTVALTMNRNGSPSNMPVNSGICGFLEDAS